MLSSRWFFLDVQRAMRTQPALVALAVCWNIVAIAAPCFGQQAANIVKFESGRFRVDVTLPESIVAELISDTSIGGKTILSLSRDVQIEFSDEGDAFDREKKDGIYTGVVPGNIQSELSRYESIVGQLASETLIPVFNGHQLVTHSPGSNFTQDLTDDTFIPILGVSAGTGNGPSVSIENSIAITSSGVLKAPAYTFNPCTGAGTPDGAWTFGHLMSELATAEGCDADQFCRVWLKHWAETFTINESHAPARPAVRETILNAWPLDENGLSMNAAPFRLLGIFNRVDLRESPRENETRGGELRFVFSFTGECESSPPPFLVIFEYQVQKVGMEVQEWGRRWAELSGYSDDAYLEALAALTREVTDVCSNPMGHRLAQLRTNEQVDSSLLWELREFAISDDGLLRQKSVAATPDLSKNGTKWLRDVINTGPLVNGVPSFPAKNEAASSSIGFFVWNVTNAAPAKRHVFAINTCMGCHSHENSALFLHVGPSPDGTTSLSSFLTGSQWDDPISGTTRSFNDLERRRQDLQNLIDTHWLSQVLPNAAVAADVSN